MGTGPEFINFSREFETLSKQPIVINDVEKEGFLEKNIFTRMTTDTIANTPICGCQYLKGKENLFEVCPYCGTECAHPYENEVESKVWMRAPNGVAGFIHPEFYIMLSSAMTNGKFDVLRWIIDRNYRPETKPPAFMDKVLSIIGRRSLDNFVSNWMGILEDLFTIRKLFKNRDAVGMLRQIIQRYGPEAIFPKYIPLPNKVLAILDENHSGTYRISIYDKLFDAANVMVGIDREENEFSASKKDQRAGYALAAYVEFQKNYQKSIIQPKEGIVRKNILGSRGHNTFRGVITSITGPHKSDELWMPWTAATVVFKLHLINILKRWGMTSRDAEQMINDHAYRYNEKIDNAFKTLIAETDNHLVFPYDDPASRLGIMSTFLRNPSLHLGSMPMYRLSKVKTNPNDLTFSIPINTTKQTNADFDGDQCSGSIVMDNVTAFRLRPTLPHRVILDLSNHRMIGGNLGFSTSTVSSISNKLSRLRR